MVMMFEELFAVIARTRILFECLALVTDRGPECLDGFVFSAQGDQGASPLFPYHPEHVPGLALRILVGGDEGFESSNPFLRVPQCVLRLVH